MALPPSVAAATYGVPRRPLPHSRRNSKVTEQSADFFAQFFAVHDHVDQTVLLEKFSSLKSFRQLLMCRFLDHARSGETNHAPRLSNDNVAQRSKTSHHPSRGRV